MSSVLISWISLTLGVGAYGVGGANLATGSAHGLRAALHSRDWWLGTGCQGLGFLFTLVARRDLPMLLVQSCVVAALVITALIQHRTGVKRMVLQDVVAVAAVVAGVAAVGAASVPGPVPGPTWFDAVVLLAWTVLLGLALFVRLGGQAASILYGSASGVGFGIMGLAARLLVADQAHPLWQFWRFPAASWATGVVGVAGLALAQVHLTRGLARGSSVGVLSCMYGLATALAALLGWILMDEQPRQGSWPYLVTGLIVGVVGTARLLRHVEDAPTPG